MSTIKLKGLFIGLVSILFMLSSCEAEKEELEVNVEMVELYHGEEFQLETNITKGVFFSSDNDCIAEVDYNGKIKARIIGSTIIRVGNGDDTKNVFVTVKPKYTSIEEPCHDFSKTKRDIYNMYGEPYAEEGENFAYLDMDSGEGYEFDFMDGNFISSQYYYPTENHPFMIYYLTERYFVLEDEGDMMVFGDHYDENKCKVWVFFGKCTGNLTGYSFVGYFDPIKADMLY